MERLATLYGLLSALIFGAGDFSGGFATKKTAVYQVLLIAQTIGMGLLVVLAVIFNDPFPSGLEIVYGALAGVVGGVALIAFYTGLAQGRMGLISPLVGIISAVLPAAVGFALEGIPAPTTLAGFAVAILAVWFLSAGDDENGRLHRQDIILALVAGGGFSLFFVFVDQASNGGSAYWVLVIARLASIGIMLSMTVYRHEYRPPPASQLPAIALAGVFDSLGNLFFALASQVGRLDNAAILSSLYPVSTVFLAWVLLRERLNARQWVGVAAAIVALVLIAA